MEDRERFEEVKRTGELQACCFTLGSSNSRMVQLYTSKQMDAKGMLTIEQYELARTLYMQWLRKANNIVQLPSSPRKKQKMGGPSLFRCASLVEGLEGSPAARTQNDCFDPVTDKIEPRERLSPDSFSECVDDGSLLNKFSMMWELRERFPLHFFVFKLPATYRTRPTSSKSFSE